MSTRNSIDYDISMVAVVGSAAFDPKEPQFREFHALEPFRYYIITTSTQPPLVVFAGQEVKHGMQELILSS